MIADQKTIDALKELNYTQVYEQGFEKGRQFERDKILEKIEGLDDMFFGKATAEHYGIFDTWVIKKQDWNTIVNKLKQQLTSEGTK